MAGPYRAGSDILKPVAHVGAVLYSGAAALLSVPTTVRVPCIQTRPKIDGRNRDSVWIDSVCKKVNIKAAVRSFSSFSNFMWVVPRHGTARMNPMFWGECAGVSHRAWHRCAYCHSKSHNNEFRNTIRNEPPLFMKPNSDCGIWNNNRSPPQSSQSCNGNKK